MAKGVAFSGDGRRMAVGDDSGVVQVWRLDTGEEPMVLLAHRHQVWALAFSPDGSLMASGDRAGQVHLWSLADGALQRTIAAGDGAIWSLAFTRDGKTLVTASDRWVQTWNIETGTMQRTLPNPGGDITRAVVLQTYDKFLNRHRNALRMSADAWHVGASARCPLCRVVADSRATQTACQRQSMKPYRAALGTARRRARNSHPPAAPCPAITARTASP